MAVEPATLMRIAELRAALTASSTAPPVTNPGGFPDLLQVALLSAIAGRPQSALPSAPTAPATIPPPPTQPVAASAVARAVPPSAASPAAFPALSGDLDASPELLSRLDRLAAMRGERWTVTSGLRTDAEQARLWANRANNPFPVARPGTSVHRDGRGADVLIGGRPIQDVIPAEQLRAAGIEPLAGDAVHVQLPEGVGPAPAGPPAAAPLA